MRFSWESIEFQIFQFVAQKKNVEMDSYHAHYAPERTCNMQLSKHLNHFQYFQYLCVFPFSFSLYIPLISCLYTKITIFFSLQHNKRNLREKKNPNQFDLLKWTWNCNRLNRISNGNSVCPSSFEICIEQQPLHHHSTWSPRGLCGCWMRAR